MGAAAGRRQAVRGSDMTSPSTYAKDLVEALGQSEAESFALEEAAKHKTKQKTAFWVDVVLAVMQQREETSSHKGGHRCRHCYVDVPRPIGRRPVVLSLGGGMDSFCMLLEGVARGEPIDVVVFMDVTDEKRKDPGEHEITYRHIRDVVVPYCKSVGIAFVWLKTECYPIRPGGIGQATSLVQDWERLGAIPVTGDSRMCTRIAKVERFEAWLDEHFPGEEVDTWIGYEAAEEMTRAKKDPNAGGLRKLKPGMARRINRFPLIEWGLCRCKCAAMARDAGWPVPRKSACEVCPYGSKGDWQRLAEKRPSVFQRMVQIEETKKPTKRGMLGTILKPGVPWKLSIKDWRATYRPEDVAKAKALAAKLAAETGRKAKVNMSPYLPLTVTSPMLPDWIKGSYQEQKKACVHCGGIRPSKSTGETYMTKEELEHLPHTPSSWATGPKGRR
jgi:hypothetical protein